MSKITSGVEKIAKIDDCLQKNLHKNFRREKKNSFKLETQKERNKRDKNV